ncbi:apoptotic chromatin condensation inducer in the nucleus-like isoform X2 [Anthonomus grandis grandis]|uniref:apoptotic chromatin condensation inducer in the nucleus-like isoform X2 n=1 Tax=Anthonomus grandis grandis TaxID=2921223 RepID=UPI0021650436|nr:apoptotic chromatin condensation inducer in the nucleus-like isoform X2 [Anthonomus grandis grandis]
MVRKTSRSAALKASEKIGRETQSPRRRTRRRQSSSHSDNSDEETKKQASKAQATNQSSGNESDTDSKKPLKKRTRSKAINQPKDVKQSKESKEEEVIEDDTEKGKSIDNNNQNNATEETESEPVQVTEKSPKEEGNGMDATLDVDTSQTLVAELACDSVKLTTEQKDPTANEEEPNKQPNEETPQENPDIDNEKTEELPPVKENSGGTKKIKLNRPRKNSNMSSSETEKEPETKKKISLKRPEIKQHDEPVPKPETKEQEEKPQPQEVNKTEELEEGEWGSTYEGEKDKKMEEGNSEKPVRRIISLKRKKENEETSLERSVSAPEGGRARKSSTDNIVINEGRRRKSVAEKSASENEEKPQKPKKPTKVVKLIRKFPEPEQDTSTEEKPTKKHKWDLSEHWTDIEIINWNILKETCPEIELIDEEEVNLDVVLTPERREKPRHRLSFKELEDQEMENIEAELNEPEDIEIKENAIALNRKISIVEDTASKLKPPPSPPRNPVSEVLFITNLVRPFTVRQLRELLERTGKIKEDGFWTDKIKSKCFVCYETAEEAEATRNALHGVHWPIGNGKQLIIDYSTREEMEIAMNPPVTVPKKEPTPEKENKPELLSEEEKRREERPSKREWDVGKERDHQHRSKSRERRERKHSRRSYTPEGYHGKKPKQDEPAPQKAMDDLFLKTKATPSIYWQPLSPEEIAEKQQLRQARLEANKRRRFEETRTNKSNANNNRRDRNFWRR